MRKKKIIICSVLAGALLIGSTIVAYAASSTTRSELGISSYLVPVSSTTLQSQYDASSNKTTLNSYGILEYDYGSQHIYIDTTDFYKIEKQIESNYATLMSIAE